MKCNDSHQISHWRRSGLLDQTAAGEGGEAGRADCQTEEEYRESVGEVGGHRQVVLQPQVGQHGAEQQGQGVELQLYLSEENISYFMLDWLGTLDISLDNG